jgi:uncharacterized repeat protein (TIGR01451 family)
MTAATLLTRALRLRAVLHAALLLLLAAAATSATAGTYNVNSSGDTWINEGSKNQTNGTATTLRATTVTATSETRALIAFTLPAIPANETITSAVLRLRVTTSSPYNVTAHAVTAAWTESTANWNGLSLNFGAAVEATFTAPPNETLWVDVTGLVQRWASGATTNHGIGLQGAAGSLAQFASEENGTVSYRPQLVITTAVVAPALTVVKSSSILSDPVNGTSSPKAIPGASVRYTFIATNTAAGTTDSNSTIFTDAVPAGMKLFVGNAGAAGSGPVTFTNGSPSSGLSYSFTSLSSTTDGLSFSNNGGASYAYVPVADASGHDANVTHVRVALTGTFAGASGGSNPSLTLQMLMQVK